MRGEQRRTLIDTCPEDGLTDVEIMPHVAVLGALPREHEGDPRCCLGFARRLGGEGALAERGELRFCLLEILDHQGVTIGHGLAISQGERHIGQL